ncbi:MAG: CDP-alcohol phosphatidyltransferase family protein [Microvirga sp.]
MATQPDESTGGMKSDARRPIAARSSGFAQKLTRALLKTSVTPNQISVVSILFAALGAAALVYAPVHPLFYLVAVAGIQLRLLCNLLDGMVAVEGGRGSPVGVLYNEIPDRIADTMLLVALGYAAASLWIGWACALAAALTAYIRLFGGALGQAQDFRGPMAKQHRMALLTGACVLALVEAFIWQERYVLLIAAWIILLGSLATCVTRLKAVAGRIGKEDGATP